MMVNNHANHCSSFVAIVTLFFICVAEISSVFVLAEILSIVPGMSGFVFMSEIEAEHTFEFNKKLTNDPMHSL